MINISLLFAILIIHWIADFILQTDKQAKGKSTSWNCLLSHTITYSMFWLPFVIAFIVFNDKNEGYDIKRSWMLLFIPITFVVHTITDYFTSRLNSKLYKEGKIHYFFVSVGFDQILHYVQLILTYYLLV